MPRYSSISFQCVDASIRAEDANFRFQSNTITGPNAAKEQILLLSTENTTIPLNFHFLNATASLDNLLVFRSADDNTNQAFRVGLDSQNSRYIVQSDVRPLVFQNNVQNQNMQLDGSGNITLNAAGTGVIDLVAATNSVQVNSTSIITTAQSVTTSVTNDYNLTVGGAIQLANTGTLTIQGDVVLQGANVTIATAHLLLENGLSVTNGAFSLNGNASITGNASISGVSTLQSVTATSLNVSNDTILNGMLSVLGNVVIGGTSTTLSNGPLISNSTTLSTFAGGVTTSGPFTVSGASATLLSGTVTAQGDTTLNKQLTVLGLGGVTITQGPLSLQQGNLSITNGSLSVHNGIVCDSGGLSLTGNLTQNAGSIISAGGDITLQSGSLYIQQGVIRVTSASGVNGLDVLNANLHVGGQTVLDKLLTLGSGVSVTSGTSTFQAVQINQALTTTANAEIGGILKVDGVANFMQALNASSSITATGPINITSPSAGLSTFAAGLSSNSAIYVNGTTGSAAIVTLAADGTRSLFTQGINVSGQSLLVSSGINVQGGNLVVASGNTTTLNGSTTVNGALTLTAGLNISQGSATIGSGGLTINNNGSFTVASGSSTILNGAIALNGAVTLAGNITSTTATISAASLVGKTLQNTSGTFTIDQNGNAVVNSIASGSGNFTTIVATGSVQGSSFGNTNGSYQVDGNGNIQGVSVLINSKIRLTASGGSTSAYTIKLPIAPPTTNGQALVSDTNGNLSWTNNIASPYPAAYTFTASNNQSAYTNITNLLFSNAGRTVYIEAVLVVSSSSTKQKSFYALTGWKDASGDGDWHLRYNWSGANIGLSFMIDSASSQVSYVSPNYANFTSLTFIISFE